MNSQSEGKGYLLLCLSPHSNNQTLEKYVVTMEGEEERHIEGKRTNDAPVKYLLEQAARDKNWIKKIVCIVTDEVKEKPDKHSETPGPFEEFRDMVNGYSHSEPGLSEYYQGREIEICPVYYGNENTKTEERAVNIYQQLVSEKCFGSGEEIHVYIDYTGGLRDTSFLMTVIIRYLEYHNAFCEKIVYSKFVRKNDRTEDKKNRIYSINCIYHMFKLLNGVEQFVGIGNARLLRECYDQEKDQDTKELLKAIVNFSKAMNLCDVNSVEKAKDEIYDGLKNYDRKKEQGSFFMEMFRGLTDIIREKLYIQGKGRLTYPQLILWCLDNDMVQQALTLYVEKMPKFYVEEGLLDLKKENLEKEAEKKAAKNSLGRTEETTAFYQELFARCEEADMVSKVQNGLNSMMENIKSESRPFKCSDLKSVKQELEDEEGKRVIDRIEEWLKKNYDHGEGKRNPQQDIALPGQEGKMENAPGDAEKMMNNLCVNPKQLCYFVYDSEEERDKHIEQYSQKNSQGMIYRRKINALNRVKCNAVHPEESRVSNDDLYQMMKYYIAAKIVRNRINHASEKENTEDEEKALEQLKAEHQVEVTAGGNLDFDRISRLLRKGAEHGRHMAADQQNREPMKETRDERKGKDK